MIPLALGESWQQSFALIIGFAAVATLTLIIVYNRWRRPDMDSRHAAHILSQLHGFGSSDRAVVVRSTEALAEDETQSDIRALWTGEPPTEDIPGTGTALRTVLSEVRREFSARTSVGMSKLPARAVSEAILTAVFGAVAVVPLTTWQRATGGSVRTPSLASVVSFVTDAAGFAVDVVFSYPFLDQLAAFVFAFGVLGASSVWSLWMIPPILLCGLAVGYVVLDARTESVPEGRGLRTWTRRFVSVGALVWVSGAVFALAGVFPGNTRVGFAAIVSAFALGWILLRAPRDDWKTYLMVPVVLLGFAHDGLAVVMSLALGGFVLAFWVRRSVAGFRVVEQTQGRDALGFALCRGALIVVAALTVPLLFSYIVASIASGKLFAVLAVIASGPSGTVFAVGFLGLVVAGVAMLAFVERFHDVRRALRRAFAIRMVRTAVFARTVPVLLVILIALVLAGTGLPLVMVLAVSLAFGVVARLAYMAFNRVTYRIHSRDAGESGASRVVITGREITDADGESVFVADVSGHRTAHRSLEALIGQINRDVRSFFAEGEPEPSIPAYYYRNGVLRGVVDLDLITRELVGDVRTRFLANVRADADADAILNKLSGEYPTEVVSQVISSLKRRGRVSRRENKFILMGD